MMGEWRGGGRGGAELTHRVKYSGTCSLGH